MQLSYNFSTNASANNINVGLDKFVLGKLSNVASAGIYGFAYHFINKKFIQHEAFGIKSSLSFAKRLRSILVFCAIASLLGYWLLTLFVPIIIGKEYHQAIRALLWLSPLRAIAASQYLAADTLNSSGHQKAESVVQLAAAVVNISLDIWLIALYFPKGAA